MTLEASTDRVGRLIVLNSTGRSFLEHAVSVLVRAAKTVLRDAAGLQEDSLAISTTPKMTNCSLPAKVYVPCPVLTDCIFASGTPATSRWRLMNGGASRVNGSQPLLRELKVSVPLLLAELGTFAAASIAFGGPEALLGHRSMCRLRYQSAAISTILSCPDDFGLFVGHAFAEGARRNTSLQQLA